MSNVMEKIASLPPSSQIELMAGTLEKIAVERDVLLAKLAEVAEENELDSIYHQLSDSGQCPWATRDEAMGELHKISAAGRLEALKTSMDLLPGALRKVASGLADVTVGADETGGKPDTSASRERFIGVVMGGSADD